MAILSVVKTPNSVLRQTAKSVGQIDKRIINLVRSMADTLESQKDPEGVGLAAPQVGESLRIFLIKPVRKSPITVFINPEVVAGPKELPERVISKNPKSRKSSGLMEGCLSVPNYYSAIQRTRNITVKYTTLDINNTRGIPANSDSFPTRTITKTFTGFPAQVVQHELDHLNGRLFVDLVLEQKKKLFKLSGDKWEEVDLG